MRVVRPLALPLLLLAAACNVGDGVTDLGVYISGRVVDGATSQPVEGATITIGGRMGASAINGAYFITDVPKGNHLLRVSKAGYAEYTEEMTVGDNGIPNKTITLAK